MRRFSLLCRALCLLLILSFLLFLPACRPSEPPADPPADPPGDLPPEEQPPEEEDPPSGLPVPEIYGDGEVPAGVGATLSPDAFAMRVPSYDGSTATEIRANEFFRLTDREEGKVYRVTDGKTVTLTATAGETRDGGGAILIAPQGLLIKNSTGATLQNLTVIGPVTVENTSDLTIRRVAMEGACALLVQEGCTGIRVEDCRLTGTAQGADLRGTDCLLRDCYLSFGACGILDGGGGNTVYHCVLSADGESATPREGIRGAADSVYRKLTLGMQVSDTGIYLGETVENCLLAENVIRSAQKSVYFAGARNSVCLLSSLVSVMAYGTENCYICENRLGGRLEAENNNYLLANNNRVPEDGYDHSVPNAAQNTNVNGNTLTDVDARAEVGVNEALLPHVNRELFVGMPRKTYVRDAESTEARTLDAYLTELSKTEDVLILPPGAYAVKKRAVLSGNTKVYAYGVYMEQQNGLNELLHFENVQNVSVHGMTLGYTTQSAGQLYVLEKRAGERVLCVTGAGFADDFGNLGSDLFYQNTLIGVQRAGTFYAYDDAAFQTIKRTGDGQMELTFSKSVYAMLEKGDIITCRARGDMTVIVRDGCSDILFEDMVIYGHTGGFAFLELNTAGTTTYHRVANTIKNGAVIDKDTYDRYRALEEAYGVSLEVSLDGAGGYRGSMPHIGSVDATHTTACARGTVAISCLFENMNDDGTNQNHSHARLAGLTDNGDGTATVYYKGNFDQIDYEEPRQGGGLCSPFSVGDRIYIYTSSGRLVCDSAVLTASELVGTVENPMDTLVKEYKKYAVTVPADAVNFAALEGADLDGNGWRPEGKVLVDNMSRSSSGFLFDNVMVRNIRSRALLIKSSDGRIQNCTFENIGMAAVSVAYEIKWGESGISENLEIVRNLIRHTGYFGNSDVYAPISIKGLGTTVEEDYLLYRNIRIEGNHILSRTTDYALYINSARDVTVRANVFGPFVGNDFTAEPALPESAADPKPVIHIVGAMHIEIADNVFPDTGYIQDQIIAEQNKHIFGRDVEMEDGTPLLPDDK